MPTLSLTGATDQEWHAVPTVFDQKRRLFVATCIPIRTGRFEFTGKRRARLLPPRHVFIIFRRLATSCSVAAPVQRLEQPPHASRCFPRVACVLSVVGLCGVCGTRVAGCGGELRVRRLTVRSSDLFPLSWR